MIAPHSVDAHLRLLEEEVKRVLTPTEPPTATHIHIAGTNEQQHQTSTTTTTTTTTTTLHITAIQDGSD